MLRIESLKDGVKISEIKEPKISDDLNKVYSVTIIKKGFIIHTMCSLAQIIGSLNDPNTVSISIDKEI